MNKNHDNTTENQRCCSFTDRRGRDGVDNNMKCHHPPETGSVTNDNNDGHPWSLLGISANDIDGVLLNADELSKRLIGVNQRYKSKGNNNRHHLDTTTKRSQNNDKVKRHRDHPTSTTTTTTPSTMMTRKKMKYAISTSIPVGNFEDKETRPATTPITAAAATNTTTLKSHRKLPLTRHMTSKPPITTATTPFPPTTPLPSPLQVGRRHSLFSVHSEDHDADALQSITSSTSFLNHNNETSMAQHDTNTTIPNNHHFIATTTGMSRTSINLMTAAETVVSSSTLSFHDRNQHSPNDHDSSHYHHHNRRFPNNESHRHSTPAGPHHPHSNHILPSTMSRSTAVPPPPPPSQHSFNDTCSNSNRNTNNHHQMTYKYPEQYPDQRHPYGDPPQQAQPPQKQQQCFKQPNQPHQYINHQHHQQQHYQNQNSSHHYFASELMELQRQYQRSIQRITNSMMQSHHTKWILQRNSTRTTIRRRSSLTVASVTSTGGQSHRDVPHHQHLQEHQKQPYKQQRRKSSIQFSNKVIIIPNTSYMENRSDNIDSPNTGSTDQCYSSTGITDRSTSVNPCDKELATSASAHQSGTNPTDQQQTKPNDTDDSDDPQYNTMSESNGIQSTTCQRRRSSSCSSTSTSSESTTKTGTNVKSSSFVSSDHPNIYCRHDPSLPPLPHKQRQQQQQEEEEDPNHWMILQPRTDVEATRQMLYQVLHSSNHVHDFMKMA